MKLHTITFILLVIGGLNWLVLGLTGWDILYYVGFGMSSTVAKIVYILVGLSAVVEIATHKKNCKNCGSMGSSSGM
jgi:uncharacterized membrane protein YuzA (DUF378 family)